MWTYIKLCDLCDSFIIYILLSTWQYVHMALAVNRPDVRRCMAWMQSADWIPWVWISWRFPRTATARAYPASNIHLINNTTFTLTNMWWERIGFVSNMITFVTRLINITKILHTVLDFLCITDLCHRFSWMMPNHTSYIILWGGGVTWHHPSGPVISIYRQNILCFCYLEFPSRF